MFYGIEESYSDKFWRCLREEGDRYDEIITLFITTRAMDGEGVGSTF